MRVRSSLEAAARAARAIPTALAVATLGALAIAAYHNSFSGAFVLDDLAAVVDNASIRAVWPPSRLLAPPETAGVGGRPLANLKSTGGPFWPWWRAPREWRPRK